MKPRIQILVTGLLWTGLAAWSFYSGSTIRGAVFVGIASILVASALFLPRIASALHRGLASFLNAVVNAIALVILSFLYICFVTPCGLVLRAVGALHTTMGPDKSLDTYWIERPKEPITPERYRRIF